MRKLKLIVEDLHVEAFEPEANPGEAKGTVAAHALTLQTCPRLYTCGSTCDGGSTCGGGYTCDGGSNCPYSYYQTCIPNCTGDVC